MATRRAEAPIFGFNRARADIVEQVVDRVCERPHDALLLLNDAAYNEIRRLAASGDSDGVARWRSLARRAGRMDRAELETEMRRLATEHAWDVAGNFDPRVYAFASHLVPPVLAALLNPRSLVGPSAIEHFLSASGIAERILLSGPVDTIRRLSRIGTVVFVPTHLSNMDSIVFGYALEQSELPPATYGAGKNLFTNPVLSFFMHNLGAYRVDRRLRHELYKDVLKTYSCVLLERGYHSLFFPGGTRSRSGAVERRLKLGLLGTGVEAFARTVLAGAPRRVFFVPATINYLLTLEAETLIEDYLQEEGKARYIIEDDESTRIGRVTAFARKLLGLEASCAIRFSDPVDFVGNRVDAEGNSYDARGRMVDPTGYLRDRHGAIRVDPKRDAQYTRELAHAVCAAYARDTIAMPTHLVAAAAFDRLRRAHPGGDLFALLRHRDDFVVDRGELAADVARLRDRALERAREGKLVLAPNAREASGESILSTAMHAFAGYHATPVLTPTDRGVTLSDPKLLLYYQDRLAVHGLAYDPMAIRATRGARSAA